MTEDFVNYNTVYQPPIPDEQAIKIHFSTPEGETADFKVPFVNMDFAGELSKLVHKYKGYLTGIHLVGMDHEGEPAVQTMNFEVTECDPSSPAPS